MRLTIRCLTCLVFLTLGLQVGLHGSGSASQTAMFRGDAQHTGVYSDANFLAKPQVRWTFHTPGYVDSSPAVADARVFFGSTDGALYSVRASDGKLVWKFPTGSRVVSSPAVDNGLVYFSSYDGNFYALDEFNGHVRWRFSTGGEHRFEAKHLHGVLPAAETMPDPFDTYLSSPALANGLVYFGSSDGNVYALDAITGNQRWHFKTGDVVHASPAVAHGTVYVGSWDSYFYALDAQTGSLRWRFKTGEDPAIHNQVGIQSSAAVAGGVVYFGCRDSHLYALDEHTGLLRWSFRTGSSWVIASPAVRDGKVYFATSDSGLFYALDAPSGKVVFRLDFRHWPMFSSPAVTDGLVVIGSHRGWMIGIDTRQGSVAWTFQTSASVRNGPEYTNADGTPNYVSAYPGSFYDDLVVGYTRLMTVGAILSSPVFKDGVLFFGSDDGNLYALSEPAARSQARRQRL